MVEALNIPPVDNQKVGVAGDDGDGVFLRFSTRGNGMDLPAGVLRYAENVRLSDKTARTRRGSKAISTDLELSTPPIILPFTLATNVEVSSITRSGSTATVTTAADHGYSTDNYVAISGADQAEYNVDAQITVTGTDSFTFSVSGAPTSPATGTIVCNKGPRVFDLYDDIVRGSAPVTNADREDGFILATTNSAFYCRQGQASVAIPFPAGEACSCPASFEQFESKVYMFRGGPGAALAVASITRSSTTATCTTVADHELATGDWVYIEGGGENEYRGIVQVTVAGDKIFTYTVAGTPTSPATGTYTAKPCEPPLVWDMNPANAFTVASTGPHATGGTKIKLPPADWAVEFNRRLWVPYAKDQILGTDYSDALTIDTLSNQTRIRPGGNDWLVGAIGFATVRLLVAYRKSLHLVSLNNEDLAIERVDRIPAAYGCVARDTLKDCNGQIFFLSDGGAARLQVTSELNLIADPLPISEDIQDLFERVNWAYADRAVAAFHDNRYYLALPLDGATTNNTIFVYSFLSGGGWESVDTYPGDFDIQGLHTADYDGRIRLHAVTTAGGLYVLEELDVDEFGALTQIAQHAIPSVIKTRYLRHGTSDVKRFKRALVELDLNAGDSLTVAASLLNPDSTAQLLSVSTASDEEMTKRPHIGRRGVACSLEIETTAGRPEFKGYTLEATASDRSHKGI